MLFIIFAALFAVACSAPAIPADGETATGMRAPPPSNPACNICFNTTCAIECPKPKGEFDPMAEIPEVPACDECVLAKCEIVCLRECDLCMKRDDMCRTDCAITMPPTDGTAPVAPPTDGATPFSPACTSCMTAKCSRCNRTGETETVTETETSESAESDEK